MSRGLSPQVGGRQEQPLSPERSGARHGTRTQAGRRRRAWLEGQGAHRVRASAPRPSHGLRPGLLSLLSLLPSGTPRCRQASFTRAAFVWISHPPFRSLGGAGFYLAGTAACRVLRAPRTRTSGLPWGDLALPGSSAAPSAPEGGMLRVPRTPG